jgi:hypothetical protein
MRRVCVHGWRNESIVRRRSGASSVSQPHKREKGWEEAEEVSVVNDEGSSFDIPRSLIGLSKKAADSLDIIIRRKVDGFLFF